ncbi:ABC transporter ATP-binding protein [Acetatifactor aquisgranensis]|uniref:ABC transporter ATP-binding protein n=1 Tax=Acetatifactor aquisgranensis TaxID=2941233 RepID=UPI00203B66CF|nr:ABC transporter ATP-binding protein [Acetatifactor aquisgranensis]MCI8544213.1 ABC transporter ATP-binding protein [Lachnospiraceae bacterium]
MDKNMATPPSQLGRARGVPAVKPKDMKGTLVRLWNLTKGHRKGLGWILLLSALASGSAVLSPYLIGRAVNSIDNGNPGLYLLAILAALYLGDWLIRFLQQFLMAGVGQRMILHIRSSLFAHMEKLPLSFFDTRQHGELMSRLTNDVDNISSTISDSLTQLMMYGFTITGIFCAMIYMSPLLTCIALLAVLLIFLLTRAVTKRTKVLFREQQAILGKLNGQVEESISGISMVKAFSREQEMVEKFVENNDAFCQVATRAQIASGYLMPMTNVINNLIYVLIAIVSGVMALEGKLTVGEISSFLLYSRQFARPFVDIANIYNNFQTAVAGAERILEILDEKCEPEDAADARSAVGVGGAVSFRNVTFGYRPDKPILRNINLEIPAGTKVAVVGPTGSGKTTLINLLTRFYDVQEGAILLDGTDLREYRLGELRQAFGVVLQDTALFGTSVRGNIAYGHDDVPMEQVASAAKAAGADSFIRRLPQGYETILHQGGAELSQGERQLLTIARAVLEQAPIMILDEATSSVDTVTEQHIRQAMLAITRGRTSFLIAHRLSTIRDSDLILLIRDGRIAEQGTHQQLMALGGEYARMYMTQMGQT